MAFLKVEIGKPLVLAIDDIAYNQPGKFGVQTMFHAGDDSFAMNPESAAKQLDHAGITDPIGLTLEFSKVDIGKGRTAINIKQVDGNRPATAPSRPAVPVTQGFAKEMTATEDRKLYGDTTDYVLSVIVPKYKTAGVEPSMAGVAAIVATLFINANKR